MFRSLHLKLVSILVLLILSIMTVVGTFLINSVSVYHLDEFSNQVNSEFTNNAEFVSLLRSAAGRDGAVDEIFDLLHAYSGKLGIDLYSRNFYILDGKTGRFLAGSDGKEGAALDLTPNIYKAIGGEPGYERQITANYIDVAVPISGGENSFIVYIRDNRARSQELSTELFMIIVEALLFGALISILLSFLLSKTMTNPIEVLIRSARGMARGEFSKRIDVHSTDEIGVLTDTFNNMAETLEKTLETVKSERDKLETIFLRMTDGVCAFSSDGVITQMNPAAHVMLSVESERGLTYDALFGEVFAWKSAMKLRAGAYHEADDIRADRVLKVFFAPFAATEGERGIMAVVHDVTEQTKMENARREFVANVSHELRTPLTNVKSYSETLYENSDIDEETKKHFLSVVMGETDRMTRIVSDLLTLSRFDYGGSDLNMRRESIVRIVSRVRDSMLLEAEKHGHTITLEIPSDMPEIICDPERIEQVVVNILANAMKYTPDGGLIELLVAREVSFVCISVGDNGVGIPESELERIFERFYRVDKARSRAAGGSGLGLAIAREIVMRHGGDIEIRSKYGIGTTVFIRLPFNDTEGGAI